MSAAASEKSAPSRDLGPAVLLTGALMHGLALALCLLTVALAGQPLYANDTWVHLALGEAFAASGPWLASDPHLFSAPGPPAPSSWLGSVVIHWIRSIAGFTGLRVAHALAVAAILGLAWCVARRFAGSARAASTAVVVFVVLSTYRLVQLRPELATIAATLGLVLLLVGPRAGPTPRAIAGAALLAALWSNLHAAFLLGPLLILGVSASLFALPVLSGGAVDPADRHRARRLGVAGVAMLLASLANPMGWRAHAAYFASGDGTLELTAVVDEWARTNLLALPTPDGFPTFAVWLVAWGCLIAVALGGHRLASELRSKVAVSERTLDPALWALSVAGLGAGILASRFLWLGLFAVIVGCVLVIRPRAGAALPSHAARLPGASAGWAGAILLATLGWLHLTAGDWVLVSRAFLSGGDYRAPYYASKFHGHAVWFLADSGVEGRLLNDYPLGGFLSVWLTPRIKMSSSGTMNVTRSTIEGNLAIANGGRLRDGDDLTTWLDREGIDLFLGTGLPIEAIPGKRGPSTVHQLEGEPSWIPVFRSLRSAVYLRRNEKNANNLAKIEAYYAGQSVPFDPAVGFDPARVISRSTDWAIDHGLIPIDFEEFITDLRSASRNRAAVLPSLHRLATLYATLGLYDRARDVDRMVLQESRDDLAAAYRQVWCLLRAGRFDEALVQANAFDRTSESSSGEVGLAANVREVIGASPQERRTLLSFLPLYTSDQAALARYGMVLPEARTALPQRPGPASH